MAHAPVDEHLPLLDFFGSSFFAKAGRRALAGLLWSPSSIFWKHLTGSTGPGHFRHSRTNLDAHSPSLRSGFWETDALQQAGLLLSPTQQR